MKVLEEIESICPECLNEGKVKKITAHIVEEDSKIWIKKTCDEHGEFKDLYFSDSDVYHRWEKFGVEGDEVKGVKKFRLYDKHISQTVLTNLLVTNRCNLRCNYCFMNAGASGHVYEPSLEQIREMMKRARDQKPVPSKAIQITGGEPTLREDLVDIIKMAKDLGFRHIQVNTNGLKLAEDEEYCKKLKSLGVDTIYLSFDGLTRETNPWIEQNKEAIENLRSAKLCVVLVPTVIKNRNLHQVGPIVEYALDNIDVVRGVNFQPISFCGRASGKEVQEGRVDYVMLFKELEKTFEGKISRDDFYPVPFMYPISKLVETLRGEKQVEFTAGFGCGGATYLFKDGDRIIPITRFIKIERFMRFIDKLSKKKGPLKKARIVGSFLKNSSKFLDKEKAPRGININKIVINAITKGDYGSLGAFHYTSLYVGSMWFQDAHNMNIDRLRRCVIHYSTPEGIVPFCSYNGLGIGEEIRKKHAISIEEWEKQTGKKLIDDLWQSGPLSQTIKITDFVK
ncbi:MAG: radical SAM protein [Candidatus Woesearchaeota archaeon]|nr:MAG: radical SAM protein [Candidatus Woesearchaeota archaeon]